MFCHSRHRRASRHREWPEAAGWRRLLLFSMVAMKRRRTLSSYPSHCWSRYCHSLSSSSPVVTMLISWSRDRVVTVPKTATLAVGSGPVDEPFGRTDPATGPWQTMMTMMMLMMMMNANNNDPSMMRRSETKLDHSGAIEQSPPWPDAGTTAPLSIGAVSTTRTPVQTRTPQAIQSLGHPVTDRYLRSKSCFGYRWLRASMLEMVPLTLWFFVVGLLLLGMIDDSTV
jgi:hypothetical protein